MCAPSRPRQPAGASFGSEGAPPHRWSPAPRTGAPTASWRSCPRWPAARSALGRGGRRWYSLSTRARGRSRGAPGPGGWLAFGGPKGHARTTRRSRSQPAVRINYPTTGGRSMTQTTTPSVLDTYRAIHRSPGSVRARARDRAASPTTTRNLAPFPVWTAPELHKWDVDGNSTSITGWDMAPDLGHCRPAWSRPSRSRWRAAHLGASHEPGAVGGLVKLSWPDGAVHDVGPSHHLAFAHRRAFWAGRRSSSGHFPAGDGVVALN